MGRKPNVGLGPSVKNPNVPKPPTGPVGFNADDETFRPLPSPIKDISGHVIGGGFVPLPFPEIGRPVVPPENKGPVGSIIGDITGGRNYKGGSPGFYGPERPDLEGIRKEDLVGGGDNRVVVPITPEDLKNRGSYKPERKVIDKSPEGRQKILDSLTREELEQRSHQDPVRGSRVQPVQDRRTRDFNPNLKSFDAKQYLANYGDLQKAFGDDEAKARQHFKDYGIKEGRVDTAGGGTLKAENRDRRAKNYKAKAKAAAVKRREGFLRGEEGATFDAKQYLSNYADLQKAFGSDEEKARQHYRQYGAKEGRVDTKM